jgi:hypothetical protein
VSVFGLLAVDAEFKFKLLLKCKKVNLSHHTPCRRLGERRYSSCSFSTSALDGGKWLASRPRRGRTPGTHCTGGWVGPRAGLDTEVRGKISCLCQGSNLDLPVVQSVVRHYTDWTTRLLLLLFLLLLLPSSSSSSSFVLDCNRSWIN